MGFLKTNNVVCFDKVTKSTRNFKSPRESWRVSGIERKTVDVVSENVGNGKRRRRDRRAKRRVIFSFF